MNNQLLFDLYSNMSTSKDAARSMRPITSRLRTRVYSVIWGAQGLTCSEVEERLSLSHQTASARIHELARMELIKDSGERRLTPSGRAAIVWEVA